MLSQERSTLPCLYVHTGESAPLGHYGQELVKNMKEHHSQQYWLYNFDGSLMTRLHQREQEIMELKLRLTEELLRENPRPVTTDFHAIARHMDGIARQVEGRLVYELKKAI